MQSLSGLFFLRFQQIAQDKLNVVAGQLQQPVTQDTYLSTISISPGGGPSHMALLRVADIGPEFVLFPDTAALNDFLNRQQSSAVPEETVVKSDVAAPTPSC